MYDHLLAIGREGAHEGLEFLETKYISLSW